jgi:hypothetical protein
LFKRGLGSRGLSAGSAELESRDQSYGINTVVRLLFEQIDLGRVVLGEPSAQCEPPETVAMRGRFGRQGLV